MRTLVYTTLAALVAGASLAGCGVGGANQSASSLPQMQTQSLIAVPRAVPQMTLAAPFALAPIQHLYAVSAKRSIQRSMRPNDHTIYVGTCGYYGSDCNLWSKRHIIATLSSKEGMSNPQGTIADPATNDWVIANTGASNVPLYDTTGGTPVLDTTVGDAGQYPVDVATIDNGKKLACVVISNIFTTGGSPGSLTVACGKKSTNLTASESYQGIGVGTDSKGNCYWSFNLSSGGGEIVEFKKCKGKATTLVTGIGFAGHIAFDGKDDMWYGDQLKGLYRCKGTKSCSLVWGQFIDVVGFNFSADFTTIYVADAGNGQLLMCPVNGGSCNLYAQGGVSDPAFGIAPIPGAH